MICYFYFFALYREIRVSVRVKGKVSLKDGDVLSCMEFELTRDSKSRAALKVVQYF